MVFCLPRSRSLGGGTLQLSQSLLKLLTGNCRYAGPALMPRVVSGTHTASPSSFPLPFVSTALVGTKQRPFQSEDLFFPFLPILHFSIVEDSMIDASLCQVPKHIFCSCQKKQGCSFCPYPAFPGSAVSFSGVTWALGQALCLSLFSLSQHVIVKFVICPTTTTMVLSLSPPAEKTAAL